MVIYKATNNINGKCYIGQTSKKLDDRIKCHMKRFRNDNNNIYFYNAMKKHGWDNFKWEVLCECKSKEELDEMEFHYIKQYDSYENGYNMTFGGEGNYGWVPSEETRKRFSNGQKNRYKKIDERLKTSVAQKKVWEDDDYRNTQTKKIKKACRTNEFRKNISEKQKELWNNDDYRSAQIKMRSKKDFRKKLSKSIKEAWKDDKYREKQSNRMKNVRKERYDEFRKYNMKKWVINGKIIDDLKSWCKERDIKYTTMFKYKDRDKCYKGYKLETYNK